MKASELSDKLIAEGCNANNFAVLSRGNDSYCLDKKGNEWVVFYSERGCDSEPVFNSTSEDAACNFFYDYILKQQHWHIIGFFKTEREAQELEARVLALGIKAIRNDIPAFNAVNDPRYRVFVTGKDIFKVRESIGNVSVKYA
jgi:hypothetical protein